MPTVTAEGEQRQWFWDAYAATYDALPKHFVPYRLQMERVLEIIDERHGSEGTAVLDAGCGTGNYAAALHENGYRVSAVDGAEHMLRRARKKLGASPADSSRCSLAELTAPLPFEDGCFDCIISINALYMLDQPENVLAEFKRVLRPGGTLVLSHPRRMPGLFEILFDHARRFGTFSVVRPLFSFAALGFFNWIIARRFQNESYFCWSEKEMQDAMWVLGFEIKSSETSYTCKSNLLLSATKQRA